MELLGDAVLHGGDRATLRLAREYPHSVATLWTALTDRSLTRLWWADLRADLRPGGEFSLEWLTGPPGELEWWPGQITAFDPPRTAGAHELRARAAAVGTRTPRRRRPARPHRLRLTNDLEGEDAWVPMSLAAWHLHLEQLDVALAGGSVDWSAWGTATNLRLRELRAAYAAHLPR